jgi:DNA-binding response OmpR family regulator
MACVWVVDEDPDFASSVATVCQADGHEVVTGPTPADALASVAQRRPDGIRLGVMFPEAPTAGFQIAREIRRKQGENPTLMRTAVNQEFPLGFSHKDYDAHGLPVSDFVEKPADWAVLREKISRWLNRGPAPS